MAIEPNITGTSPEIDSARILLVDDNPSILEGVADLLELYGYDIITAESGNEALGHMQDARPDLVISDIMMPGMDGYEFYKVVRSNPDWVPIPFIFLTARGQQHDIRRGHSLGADAYLTKPFEPEDLLSAIQGRLRRVRDIATAAKTDVDRMKQQLITIFSHELRTPLTYIYGYVNLLRDQHEVLDPTSVDEMLDGIQRGAERLTRLVEDLMLMVRIDSGVVEMEVTFQQATMPLTHIINGVLEAYEQETAARGILLECDIADNLQGFCASLYLQDALMRLVDNGIKFCRQTGGRVMIKLARTEDDQLAISVIDNGIGIEPEQKRTIFESFRQANREVMEQQGLGMGLTLAQSLVEILGGHINVESNADAGSTFTITLPINNVVVLENGDCETD